MAAATSPPPTPAGALSGPKPPPNASASDAFSLDASAVPRRRTLLIIDDEIGPRESLRVVFKDLYNLLVATDGPAAINLAQSNHVDVAVCDVRMQGMSGIEVLERLKFVNPAIEVVMLTAFETTDTMRQALRLQACDYLNKPFDVSAMRAAVANAMHRRTLASQANTETEKFQELVTELQNQKMEDQITQTRGEIYASIIHDINGPLTVISGFVQLMHQRIAKAEALAGDDLAFVKERLKTVSRQVANCIEISSRYLGFLRRSGDDAPRAEVNEILSDLAHLVGVHPSKRLNEFKIEPLREDIAALMNGTDLIQVLLNLAVNGFQCVADPHTVKISANVFSDPLDLSLFKDGPQDRLLNVENFDNTAPLVGLSVQDTGPGIPPEILPKIFHPFFTTKGSRQGTGLGLSIVQRFIKEAGGALHLHTEKGVGTIFTVYLKAAAISSNGG
jgi:signal transduction histidine kinase